MAVERKKFNISAYNNFCHFEFIWVNSADEIARLTLMFNFNMARMMQDYELNNNTGTSIGTASTVVQPSPQVVQNILQYARCFQNIRIGDINIKVYLN